MAAPEMFGVPVHNFGEPQNARSTQNSAPVRGEGSPESPALDLKCYVASSTPTTNPTGATSGRNSSASNHNSPPRVGASSLSPTEHSATVAEPENLSTAPAKEQQDLPRLSNSSLGPMVGRCTPKPARDMDMPHHDPSSHPPPSLLGPSSLYQPFCAVRQGSFYPIEHYFPHPGSHPPVHESRHAPPPPPIAKTPPR